MLIATCLLANIISFGQKHTISGTVKSLTSGENLIGASIYSIRNGKGTTANNYGFYSLTLDRDSVTLRFSYVGHQPLVVNFLLSGDTTVNINLDDGTQLQEIVISADEEIQETTRMGTIDIPVEQLKKMPALLGEVDVLKVLQLLPGVQTGVEGSSGLYVRGGGPDQNLILLDGVPVYNASHLFGFFSVFNADAINRVELIKGGFPARYGGRLSSVIDISMKEGNNKEFRGEGSVGIVASRLTVEGPVSKNASFIISGRRTYIDVLATPLIKLASKGDQTAGYHFYDLNGKINYQINDKNRVFLSAYTGDDKAYGRSRYEYTSPPADTEKQEDEFGLRWGNLTTAMRWNSIITPKLFSNVTATYSRYRFNIFADFTESYSRQDTSYTDYFHTDYISGIRDYAAKVDFDYIPDPNHYIKFGGQAINHRFSPGVISFSASEVPDTTLGAQRIIVNEYFIYLEDDFRISDRLKVNAGMHASAFYVEGRWYRSLQPRLAARYLITPDLSWKASYASMTQFIHLLTNAGIGLPTDLWVPATALVGPEQSFIWSTGAAYNLRNKFEFSLEGYYKKMDGLIEYKEGARYVGIDNDWQTKVGTGIGESYGAEVFAQKKTGKINGWIGYTLSWTNRTFPEINEGRTFPYRYDRRHDIGIAAAYAWKENREFSLTWVYGTGNAVTLPQSSYKGVPFNPWDYFVGKEIEFYGDRNSYRMRGYHRLDIGYTTTKKTKWGERSWTIGVYNVYSRRNPFFMDLGQEEGTGDPKFIQYSLFPVIPSIAYRFKF